MLHTWICVNVWSGHWLARQFSFSQKLMLILRSQVKTSLDLVVTHLFRHKLCFVFDRQTWEPCVGYNTCEHGIRLRILWEQYMCFRVAYLVHNYWLKCCFWCFVNSTWVWASSLSLIDVFCFCILFFYPTLMQSHFWILLSKCDFLFSWFPL